MSFPSTQGSLCLPFNDPLGLLTEQNPRLRLRAQNEGASALRSGKRVRCGRVAGLRSEQKKKKRKLGDSGPSEDHIGKYSPKRMAKNRVSAQRSRQRKAVEKDMLESQVRCLSTKNRVLTKTIEDLSLQAKDSLSLRKQNHHLMKQVFELKLMNARLEFQIKDKSSSSTSSTNITIMNHVKTSRHAHLPADSSLASFSSHDPSMKVTPPPALPTPRPSLEPLTPSPSRQPTPVILTPQPSLEPMTPSPSNEPKGAPPPPPCPHGTSCPGGKACAQAPPPLPPRAVGQAASRELRCF